MITTERIPAIPPELDERPSSAHAVEESLPYRLKSKLLGEPLLNEDLQHERLGNATALAVFASDNLSSCAYATEEILRVLVPAIGLAAFTLVTPVTIALLVVLGFLIGPGPFGKILYFALQAGTMLILVLAANTSFADFPRLASFHQFDAKNPINAATRPGTRPPILEAHNTTAVYTSSAVGRPREPAPGYTSSSAVATGRPPRTMTHPARERFWPANSVRTIRRELAPT